MFLTPKNSPPPSIWTKKWGFVLAFFFISLFQSQLSAQNINIRFRSQLPITGQTLANICGYSKNGRDYALLGGQTATIVVDVTNPDAPVILKQIPIVNNLWKEIKVYRGYAYTVSEGGGGLQIVNLNNLPDTTLPVRMYTGDSSIAGLYNRTHALHIDTTKGFLYLFGTVGLNGSGATILDLRDPWNPKYVGKYDTRGYIHDGYVDNDTLYAGHINGGYMTIADMRNKSLPVTLSQTTTPGSFTHNVWPTKDKKALLTTDEIPNSVLASYDISNPSAPRLLDKIQITPGSGSIVHNVHVRGNYAVTSWYRDGIVITDVTRPNNLVNVGWYDTYTQGVGDGFDGAWGVFPLFNSETIVVSNINEGLFVLSPTYVRANYLEGTVIDSLTRQVLAGVTVKINSTDLDKRATTGTDGIYRTGQVTVGSFTVTYSKVGYFPKTVTVSLQSGVVTTQNIELKPKSRYSVIGTIVSARTGLPIAGAKATVTNSDFTYDVTAGANGQFTLTEVIEGQYTVFAGAWGYRHGRESVNLIGSATSYFRLNDGYEDHFWGDFAWVTGGTAPRGRFVREVPNGTTYNGVFCNPNIDAATDMGEKAYISGNAANSAAGDDDIDDGDVTLTSPIMKLRSYGDPRLDFSYWFFNSGGSGTPNDSCKVRLSNGTRDTLLWFNRTARSNWTAVTNIRLKDFLPMTDSVTITFSAADALPGHLVEFGVDQFVVRDAANGTTEIQQNWKLSATPNPFKTALKIDYDLPDGVENARLLVFDQLGRQIFVKKLVDTGGGVFLNEITQNGVYFLRIEANGAVSKTLKVVKID